jgi:hypothetical protein
MISPDLLEFFVVFIEGFNSKQKTIAENLMFDKTYYILRVYDNKIPKLILKNRFTNEVLDFEAYVKSKCNC